MHIGKLKAGKYYIGDPCYTVREHDAWLNFLSAIDIHGENMSSYNGKLFYAGPTAYGDGTYVLRGDGRTKRLGVDAGMLFCIPETLAPSEDVIDQHSHLWGMDGDGLFAYHTFDEDFDVYYAGGIFRFGDLNIDTKNDFPDDEQE